MGWAGVCLSDMVAQRGEHSSVIPQLWLLDSNGERHKGVQETAERLWMDKKETILWFFLVCIALKRQERGQFDTFVLFNICNC